MAQSVELPSPASALRAREDTGYFGPESISWRLFADPSSKLGGVAAILLQALNPDMIRLFAEASSSFSDLRGRAARTSQYIETTIFGDRAHADAAAVAVRRLHAARSWHNPRTGEDLRADTQEWLEWTHNTVVWGVLRAAEAYGPALTPAEQDEFVREQHTAARLAGVTRPDLVSSWDALRSAIEEEQDWLALSVAAVRMTKQLGQAPTRAPLVKRWVDRHIQRSILALLPEWALLLYAVSDPPRAKLRSQRITKLLFVAARRHGNADQGFAKIIEHAHAHPYRTIRTEQNETR